MYNNYAFVKDEENLEFIVISEAQKVLADINNSAAEQEEESKFDQSRIKRGVIRVFREN